MVRQLEGKVALVTGGSSGIGRATALAFAREGAKVVVSGRSVERLRETVGMIKEVAGEAIFVQADVSRAIQVEMMVNKAVESYGKLNCAFNNAGIGVIGSTVDCTEQDWDQIMSINLKGVWLCMKHEITQMLKQGSGTIVNNSSVGGLVGAHGIAAYIASKHGVIGLTKSAALEYAKAGIRVNTVCPGAIRTPPLESLLVTHPEITEPVLKGCPMDRIAEPEEVAEAVVWLCSDAASFVTGHSMVVDGGFVVQ